MNEVFKLEPDAILPTRNLSTDAGIDLYAHTDTVIPKGHTKLVKTYVAIKIEPGFVGKIEDRSSMALKGYRTGGGVIDALYNGSVDVVIHNFSNEDGFIGRGTKIAQLLIYKVDTGPVWEVKELWSSQRGDKGFGSSDVKKV